MCVMKLIPTRTLEAISKYKNSVIRLGSYLLESESDYIINKMGEVTGGSDITDVVSAINQDLASTAKFVNSLAKVIQTLDENDVSTELDNGETDFKEVFPNHYSHGRMEVFGVTLSKTSGTGLLSPDEIKQRVFNHAFPEHDFKDFKALVKLVNRAMKADEVNMNMSFEKRLAKVINIHAVNAYKPFFDDVMKSADKIFDIRMQMKDQDKMLVDQKVLGGRAMIDGVILASTFINTTDGFVQTASSHKGQNVLLNSIKQMVSELPFLKAVEIDPDTDLQKFHDLVFSLKDMSFSNVEPFELKSRKLGNYGASGLNVVTYDGEPIVQPEYGYANNSLRVVGIDTRSSPSVAHELAHYGDTKYNSGHFVRSTMVSHYGNKIDSDILAELYGDKTAAYIMNDREIVARMGEIGLALHHIGFEDGDDVETVLKKATAYENAGVDSDGSTKFNVAVTKRVSEYMAVGNSAGDLYKKEIYFNMAEWTPDELSAVKDYTKSFYFDIQPEVQQALKDTLEKHQTRFTTYTKVQKKRVNKKRVVTISEVDARKKLWATLKHDKDIFGQLLEVGKKENLFQDGEFSYYATVDLSKAFVSSIKKSRIDINLISLQYENYANLAKKATEMGAVGELSVLKHGSGLMGAALTESKSFENTNEEVRYLLSRVGGISENENVSGIEVDQLLKMRPSRWNSLDSDTVFGRAWRESIERAYTTSTEGFNFHADNANVSGFFPVAETAFIGNYVVEKTMAEDRLSPEIVEQVANDNFNMSVIAFSDEEKMADRLSNLSQSKPHQELLDVSNLMFRLGDEHIESGLAEKLCGTGLLDELGIDDEFVRAHISSDKMQAILVPEMKESETLISYINRVEENTYPKPAKQNYHDVYCPPDQKIEPFEMRFGKVETENRLPMRTSPLLIVGNLVQQKAGVDGLGKYIAKLENVLSESPEFKELLDDVAKTNIVHYNFVKSSVRGGRLHGDIKTLCTPESSIIENMTMQEFKSHPASKVTEVKPTQMMRELLRTKLLVELVTISNPQKAEPMSVRAVRLSRTDSDRLTNSRIVPVGQSTEKYMVDTNVIPMTTITKQVGEVANKINTPRYEKSIYIERPEGRGAAIDFQKTLASLEGMVGSKAYEVLNFAQRTMPSHMPYSDKNHVLQNVWSQMSNYLIQNYHDIYIPIEHLVQECENVYTLQRAAEATREMFEELVVKRNIQSDEPPKTALDVELEEFSLTPPPSTMEELPNKPSRRR